MNTAAIATKLNVLESAIVRIEEWANVLFVVAKGVGARFVSKKVGEKKMKAEYNWNADGTECKAELITDRPHQMGCDYYKVSVLKTKKFVGKPSISSFEFVRNVKADEFVAAMSKANLI